MSASRRRSSPDEDIIANIGTHTVCWRYYGNDSPNKGQVSVILKTKEGWTNLGVWKRGPVPLSEIEALIIDKNK